MNQRPRGFAMRSERKLRMLLALVCLVVVGCSRSQVVAVNRAAIASRVSYTDPTSRLLAQKSLALLSDRATDYRVGPEDILEISIFEWELRNETRTMTVRVAGRGVISLPVLGELKVDGLTVEQIKELIEAHLIERGILQTPRVNVLVREYRSKRVAVLGAVRDPGVYTLRQNVATLLEVLTLAGGPSERAGQVLYVLRPKPPATDADATVPDASTEKTIISVDLYELLDQGSLELNMVLQNGDVIHVPQAQQFFVVGFVRQPGAFPLTRPTTVLDAIAMANGLREAEASPRACVLKRRQGDAELLINLDLVAISAGEQPNLYLMPNDIIDVRQTWARRVGLGVLDLVKNLFNLSYVLN